MDKLKISLLHCHGIKRLATTTFDFKEKGHVAVYASNGTMKSSLAKTFQDIWDGKEPGDRLYPERRSRCTIADETGASITKDSILVLNPYRSAPESIDMPETSARILASPKLGADCKAVLGRLYKKLDDFLKHLKSASGLAKASIVTQMLDDFGRDPLRAYEVIELLGSLNKLDLARHDGLQNVQYKIVFQKAVLDLLKEPKFRRSLKKYIAKYRRLNKRSRYFQAEFSHNNAATASKKLETLGFFKAKHTVGMRSKHDGKFEVLHSADDFDKEIESEKLKIMKKLDDVWNDVDSRLATAPLQEFRRHLDENQDLLVELDDVDSLKTKLWKAYMSADPSLLDDAVAACRLEKPNVVKLLADVKTERRDWDAVVEEFNKRFKVPFTVSIRDRTDAVLGISLPHPLFHFKDGRDAATVDQTRLSEVLSAGEQNAFYILNMLFEVKRRMVEEQETVIVMDDIADSFDYKNKYTIVQYISEIAAVDHFRLIILTHNFDFFRTLLSRRIVGENHAYVASVGANGAVKLRPGARTLEALHGIMSGRAQPKMLVAALPFARNLVQYIHGTRDKHNDYRKDYSALSNMLHWRDDTENYKISELLPLLKSVFHRSFQLKGRNRSSTVFCLIMSEADKIADSNTDPDLYAKITLSIAVRICAEKFMVAGLRGRGIDPLSEGKYPSTSQLASLYGKELGIATGSLPAEVGTGVAPSSPIKDTLDKVVLMTPEIIHLNSFMYEPILDMSGQHLADLYKEVKELGGQADGR